MQIILQSTGHAKSLAKSLCRSLAGDRELKLTAAQAVVARMFGYADHRALCAAAGKGDPDPYEDEMEADAASARRQIFAARLAQALDIPVPKARALVDTMGPLRRDWQGHDDWRARRQAYFAADPLAGLTASADFQLWLPGLGSSDHAKPEPRWHMPSNLLLDDLVSDMQPDPTVYGPKAYTVDIVFGREVEPKFVAEPKPVAAKAAFGIEYVYAKIAMGDRVIGWLRGVVADPAGARTRKDFADLAALLDGPLVARAGELFQRRIARELGDEIGGFEGRVFVVAALVRHPSMTIPGAGAALLAEAARVVTTRFGGKFHVVLNATPPQYRPARAWAPFEEAKAHVRKLGMENVSTWRDYAGPGQDWRTLHAEAKALHAAYEALPKDGSDSGRDDEKAIRSTGRAAAARSLREHLLGIRFPEEMADVQAFDLDLPYRCAVPMETDPPGGSAYALVIDDAGALFHDREEVPGERHVARALLGGTPDPSIEALLVGEDTVLEGFSFEDAWLMDRIVRPHPSLWKRMPKALRRIEIERAEEDPAWTMVRRELIDYDAPAQFRPALRPVRTDTLVFVFENGTRASVPERQLATGDCRDVLGGAFTDRAGRPLRHNPYTDEMSIGDLWSMLTANAALLYSGGEPLSFRDGRIVLIRP